MQNLVARFKRVGLDLQLPRTPLVRRTPKVFQMDIRRDRASETYRLWRGNESNRVEVTAVDRDLSQLVLTVKESATWFEERVSKRYGAGPSGEHLIALMRHSDEVLAGILSLAGREEAVAAMRLVEVRGRPKTALQSIDAAIDGDGDKPPSELP